MRSKTFASVKSSVKSAGNVLGNEKMSKSNQRQRSGSGHVDTRKLFLVLRSRGVAVGGLKRENQFSLATKLTGCCRYIFSDKNASGSALRE
jgi:hypothetical protein